MIGEKIKEALARAAKIDKSEVELGYPEKEEFGDYTSNIAMVLGKKDSINPRQKAQELIDAITEASELKDLVEKTEIAGPGFINFYLKEKYLLTNLENIISEKENYGKQNFGNGKTVVIDYSSPNIAKRFGIGHLRSTIIGQALYNLHALLGYKVIGDNHLGDWGTQFGTLLYQITSNHLDMDSLSIVDLENLYVQFNKELEDNKELKEEAKKWFKKLEDKDPEATEIWKKAVDKSLVEFNRIYEILDIKIDYAYGESFYSDKMQEVIELIRARSFSRRSEGAEVVDVPGLPIPAMIVKGDGSTTYLTRDLAAINYRKKEWKPDTIIYEVGSDQVFHFRQVFGVAKLLGWDKDTNFIHVAHGLIRFAHGKMSTRRGQTIKLEDVLEEAIEKAGIFIAKAKITAIDKESEKEIVKKKIGISALKYFDLMHNPQSDIVFDWEKIFVLEGNSGPYMQYTYARTQSVLRKAGISKLPAHPAGGQFEKEELSLMRHLAQYYDQTFIAAKMYSPNILADYLYKLAQKYNTFYSKVKIIGSENEDFRLLLNSAVGQVLKNGLTILGIEVLEKM